MPAHLDELQALHAALTPERGGAAVVVGEHGQHLGRAIARSLLEEGADLEVPARAHGLGQHAVGHVADQHVLEAELTLPLHVALAGRHEDLLLLQRGERAAKVLALGVGERGSAPSGKVLPTTAACCTSRRSNSRSESSRAASTPCTVSGRADPRRPPRRSGAPFPRRTAGCRPSARPRPSRARSRPAAARPPARALRGAEQLEHELGGRAAPAAARPPVEQLVAGRRA